MTRCPKCGHRWKLKAQQRGGRARVPKGFASPAVMEKALETRRRRALIRKLEASAHE